MTDDQREIKRLERLLAARDAQIAVLLRALPNNAKPGFPIDAARRGDWRIG
jgi:hypothetical protein